MSGEEIVKVDDPLDLLTKEEAKAYRIYLKKNDPPLSPRLQAELFSLYLNGSSCEEIANINPNIPLGMIVRARIDGMWDLKRSEHVEDLLTTVRDRAMQAQLESVKFTSDLLATANKQFGDKLKRYLQTGDEKELGSLKIDSLKGYRDAVDLLLKLTGQDKKVEVKGEVKNTVEFTGKFDAKTAAALLKLADKDGE